MNRSSLFVFFASLLIGVCVGVALVSLAEAEERVAVPMWMEVVHRVSTSVGGLGTLLALIFVIRQFNLLRAQSELVQKNTVAALDGQLYARLDSFNKFIVEHDKEYELLDQPYVREEPSDHKYRLHHLCDLGFTFFEEIYKHRIRYNLLETEDWEEWQQNMAHFLSKRYVRGYWPTVAVRYARSFQTFANDLLAKMERGSKSP